MDKFGNRVQSTLITFHKILPGCEEGSREAWLAFLSNYTPIVSRLLDIYLPSCRDEQRKEFWRTALRDLSANKFERLRTFDHRSEREFLVEMRAFFLEHGAANVNPSRDTTCAPRPAPEKLNALLKGLPLLHQEILFLKLAGYADATLEKLLRITPAVALKGLERLQADYSIILRQEQDVSLWPAAWSEVLRYARASKQGGCPPLRQFVRILDGQVSWYDKDPVEQHMTSCLHCLERWTALRELVHWRREAKPLSLAELEALLSCLPIQTEAKAGKSFLGRIFG